MPAGSPLRADPTLEQEMEAHRTALRAMFTAARFTIIEEQGDQLHVTVVARPDPPAR